MSENAAERGHLAVGQWVTIYAGTEAMTFFIRPAGTIPITARIEVEVNGAVEGRLTQENPDMHANGTKIRLHNVGPASQVYNYYPVE